MYVRTHNCPARLRPRLFPPPVLRGREGRGWCGTAALGCVRPQVEVHVHLTVDHSRGRLCHIVIGPST